MTYKTYETESQPVSIKVAARILKEKPGTLRRYCKQGMPHHPGGRGRGKAQMVDLHVCREWIGGDADSRLVLTLANDVQQQLAASIWQCWERATVLNRRREAGLFAAVWHQCAANLLEHLRKLNNETPALDNNYPAEIKALLKIARGD